MLFSLDNCILFVNYRTIQVKVNSYVTAQYSIKVIEPDICACKWVDFTVVGRCGIRLYYLLVAYRVVCYRACDWTESNSFMYKRRHVF